MNASVSFRAGREALRGVADDFQACVLPRVSLDRVGLLTQDQTDKIAKGQTIDRRVVRLMTISGKGGPHENPTVRAHFAESQNVSLLDHLMSVARGAALWSVLWMTHARAQDELEPPAPEALEAVAALAMALGFMHDLNKLSEDEHPAEADLASLSVERFHGVLTRYGVDEFLKQAGWEGLQSPEGPAMFRQLVLASEVGQAPVHLHAIAQAWVSAGAPAGMTAAVVEKIANRCVRWADRMDGAWLKQGAEGLQQEIERLAQSGDAVDRRTLSTWATIELRDAHHPFVLDALLVAMEKACEALIQADELDGPPLVGVHHDGVLLALVPAAHRDRIVQESLDQLEKDLPFGMVLALNARKGFSLEGKVPTWDELVEHWATRSSGQAREAQRLLELHNNAFSPALWSAWGAAWSSELGAALTGSPHLVMPPEKEPLGQYTPFIRLPWIEEVLRSTERVRFDGPEAFALAIQAPTTREAVQARFWVRVMSPALALMSVLLLNPTVPRKKNAALMPWTPDERRQQVQQILADAAIPLPPVLPLASKDAFTGVVALVFGAITACVEASDPAAGQKAMAALWQVGQEALEGTPVKAGLMSVMPTPWQHAALAELKDRLMARIEKRAIAVDGRWEEGPRCLFLDEPLPPTSEPIGSEFGLYGVKMSAFSGRSGRPDSLMSAPPKGVNYISGLSRCEHALRGECFKAFKGKGGGIPIVVSSPLRVGLFASVRHQVGMEAMQWQPQDLSTYDVLRAQVKEGQRNLSAEDLVVEAAMPMGGYRLSRYEDFPSRLEDQIEFLLRWLDASRRFGRPVHLFRGLAHPLKAFFAFDAMPALLCKFLNGNAWRLEELPQVIVRLKLAQWLFDKKNGGPGGHWLALLADDHTAWMTAAFLLSLPGEDDRPAVPAYLSFILEEIFMTHASSTHLTELARLAAQFQKSSTSFYRMSNSEKARAFSLAYDAWRQFHAKHLEDTIPLAMFIASEVQENLARKNAFLDGQAAAKALEAFAQTFVTMATPKVMATDMRRALNGAYVFCFGKALEARFEAIRLAKTPAAPGVEEEEKVPTH